MSIQLSRKANERLRLLRKAERRYEREAFRRWADAVIRKAQRDGMRAPTFHDMKMLKTLAEISGSFTPSQVVRAGWRGVKTASEAEQHLERFVAEGWIYRILSNRLGQARYSFTREGVIGRLPTDDRPFTSIDAWNQLEARGMLMAAEFLPTEFGEDEEPEAECIFCPVPDQSAEADIWRVARELAFEKGTMLHALAGCIQGMSPIHTAYALAIANDRVVSDDPARTSIRGLADYLGVDYNALRIAVSAASEAIRKLNEKG